MRPTSRRPPTCSCIPPPVSRGGRSRPGPSWATTTRPSTRIWSGPRPSGWVPPPTRAPAAPSPCCRTPTSSSTSSAPPQQASEPAPLSESLLPAPGGQGSEAARSKKGKPVASEQVLDIPVRRHVLTSERAFQVVLDGIYDGISQPDIGALFATLAASTSYAEFAALVRHAQGSAGLMRFLHLDDDHVLALDPQARDRAARRLVRLIAGNPVTMGQMTRHLPAAGSYAPVTILIHELPGGGTQVAYDTVASAIAPYGDDAASQVARRLDTAVPTAPSAPAPRAGNHEQILPTDVSRLPAKW